MKKKNEKKENEEYKPRTVNKALICWFNSRGGDGLELSKGHMTTNFRIGFSKEPPSPITILQYLKVLLIRIYGVKKNVSV